MCCVLCFVGSLKVIAACRIGCGNRHGRVGGDTSTHKGEASIGHHGHWLPCIDFRDVGAGCRWGNDRVVVVDANAFKLWRRLGLVADRVGGNGIRTWVVSLLWFVRLFGSTNNERVLNQFGSVPGKVRWCSRMIRKREVALGGLHLGFRSGCALLTAIQHTGSRHHQYRHHNDWNQNGHGYIQSRVTRGRGDGGGNGRGCVRSGLFPFDRKRFDSEVSRKRRQTANELRLVVLKERKDGFEFGGAVLVRDRLIGDVRCVDLGPVGSNLRGGRHVLNHIAGRNEHVDHQTPCCGPTRSTRRAETHGIVHGVHARDADLTGVDAQEHGNVGHKRLGSIALVRLRRSEKLVRCHGQDGRHHDAVLVHEPPLLRRAAAQLHKQLSRLRVHEVGPTGVGVVHGGANARHDARHFRSVGRAHGDPDRVGPAKENLHQDTEIGIRVRKANAVAILQNARAVNVVRVVGHGLKRKLSKVLLARTPLREWARRPKHTLVRRGGAVPSNGDGSQPTAGEPGRVRLENDACHGSITAHKRAGI
eukprot:m.119933 g.119933  ORF g.119933 m.119933 type:complete len:532 (-) comp11038_c0_seq7:12276-13871(-)